MCVQLGVSRPHDEVQVLLWLLAGHLPEPLGVYLHRTLADAKKLNPGATVSPPPGFIGSVRASSILQHLRAAHTAYAVAGGEASGEPVVLMPDETPLLGRRLPEKGSRASPFSAEESEGEDAGAPTSPVSQSAATASRSEGVAGAALETVSDDDTVLAPKLPPAKKSRLVLLDSESEDEAARGPPAQPRGTRAGKPDKSSIRKQQAKRLRFFAQGAERPMRSAIIPPFGHRFNIGWPGPPELQQRRGPPPYARDRDDVDPPRDAGSRRRDSPPAKEASRRDNSSDRSTNNRQDRRRSQSAAPAWHSGEEWRYGR